MAGSQTTDQTARALSGRTLRVIKHIYLLWFRKFKDLRDRSNFYYLMPEAGESDEKSTLARYPVIYTSSMLLRVLLQKCIEIPVHIGDNRFVGIVLGYVLNHQHYALGTVELFLGIVVELKEELD